MPRKKAKKTTAAKAKGAKGDGNKKVHKDLLSSWLAEVNSSGKGQFIYNSEIFEINSDEDDDEGELNLKELEKPMKTLLRKHPDEELRKRVNKECEWGKCTFETIDEKLYVNHVHNHLLEIDEADPTSKCQWNLCKFETDDKKHFLRHVDYHAYQTCLKTFGLGLTNILSIPHCKNDSKLRNKIPAIENDYICYWSNCGANYSKFHSYLEHVNYHLTFEYENGTTARRHERKNLCDIKVDCKWERCNRQLRNIFELKRHMRIHTKEKKIGCANCGFLFSNKPLFLNHCIRQVSERSFQCPDCFKFYPSAKVLKDHTLIHVNKFQCEICGLSCQRKSVLAKHIIYRHMKDKPFACDQCDYRGKTKSDLDLHSNTHKEGDNLFKCEVFQCDYSSKTLMALKRHDAKVHLGQPQTYQCHCCDKSYSRGFILSKHLMKEHQFRLPPGHSRFIYKRDWDGLYRLQTKRVEDLKEREEVLDNFSEDSNMDVSFQLEGIAVAAGSDTPVNVKFKKVVQPKAQRTPMHVLTEDSNNSSVDINDFAIVKKYKKILKKK